VFFFLSFFEVGMLTGEQVTDDRLFVKEETRKNTSF
jgi:hypothetical protein